MSPIEDDQLLTTTGHSTVRLLVRDGSKVIIKRALDKSDRSRNRWKSEVAALQLSFGHPHIVELVSQDEQDLSLTFAFSDGESLDQLVDSDGFSLLDQAGCAALLEQMISALAYLHAKSIIHDDIKPHNILWSVKECKATLIDFGAALLPPWGFTPSGTPAYVTPEFINGQKDPKGDVWALGVTMAFARRYVALPEGEWFLPGVFQPGPERDALLDWHAELVRVRSKVERDGRGLEASMLDRNVETRPSSRDLQKAVGGDNA